MFGHGSWLQRAPQITAGEVRFFVLSLGLHALIFLWMTRGAAVDDKPLFQLPATVEFGVSEEESGGGDKGPKPPPPAPAVAKAAPKTHKAMDKSDRITLPVDAGTQVDNAPDAGPSNATALAARSADGGVPEDELGSGPFGAGTGEGSGSGPGGDGSGAYAPKGATIALNIDLERVRKSALVLETEALLGIIPQWEALFAGSGIDPTQDLLRVFVATPNLQRASVVVAARHALPRERIDAAVNKLARERGRKADWYGERGFQVASWPNRGPTQRVVAITADDQLIITRSEDLRRVLSVARALAKARVGEGFTKEEVKAQGGLLAMQADEAVALWVEGVRHYVPRQDPGVPLALRMSVHRVDEFHCELRATGRYESPERAQAAMASAQALRKELGSNGRVIYLGLQNAVEQATLTQEKAALVLRMTLTLHQTRYLMQYVSAVLKPRAEAGAEPAEPAKP